MTSGCNSREKLPSQIAEAAQPGQDLAPVLVISSEDRSQSITPALFTMLPPSGAGPAAVRPGLSLVFPFAIWRGPGTFAVIGIAEDLFLGQSLG